MKKQTLLLLLLLTSFVALSQASRIIDDTPVGLGISVRDRQTGLKKHNVFHQIITPPTIIKTEKNSNGELYIKIYVNSDEVEVIAAKINDSNKHLYKVFEKNTFLYDDTLSSASKTEEIVRCKSSNNYTTFYFTTGEKLIVSKPIYEYENLLADYHFIRCHQSHLVNKKYIKSWVKEEGGYLLLDDKTQIPVARQKREMVKELLLK